MLASKILADTLDLGTAAGGHNSTVANRIVAVTGGNFTRQCRRLTALASEDHDTTGGGHNSMVAGRIVAVTGENFTR